MYLISLVIAHENREQEETCKAGKQSRTESPPQVIYSALHVKDALCILESCEHIELPNGDRDKCCRGDTRR